VLTGVPRIELTTLAASLSVADSSITMFATTFTPLLSWRRRADEMSSEISCARGNCARSAETKAARGKESTVPANWNCDRTT